MLTSYPHASSVLLRYCSAVCTPGGLDCETPDAGARCCSAPASRRSRGITSPLTRRSAGEGNAEKLIQRRAMEAVDKAVGLLPADARGALPDRAQLKIELIGVIVAHAELSAVVADHRIDRHAVLGVKGQQLILQHRDPPPRAV